ncbi:cytochrome c biogenesis protein [Anaeromyxobacter paludicola]|uniref:Cytochrome c biogenesis protein ResC n=1 Tax=Anaeromyxobacter paludicola TaxID=2918171 RepID=A0ABM7XAP2_9BACT|nr:cytochrome c biogenesis protein CcsA [Anaeromyxobacter paludicola]BDG08921.1 cytochrome c biogenesis protein ResC [Anaeromyxobacter paludicola]
MAWDGFRTQVVLQWGAVACDVAAAALFTSAALFARPARARWARWCAALGLAPHGVAIALRWLEVGHGPYMMKYEVLTSISFTAVALLLVFLWRRPDWSALAVVVMPVAILLLGLGLFAHPAARDLPPTLRSAWLVFHVIFAKLSAGAFILSLATAICLLRQERRPSPRIPPADALDAYTVRFVGFGFVFWSVTIAAGAIWANQSWGRYWGWDPIETWSLVSWLVYAAYLHARLFFRMARAAAAWLAIACFALFILTFLVLTFVVPSLHSAYLQ